MSTTTHAIVRATCRETRNPITIPEGADVQIEVADLGDSRLVLRLYAGSAQSNLVLDEKSTAELLSALDDFRSSLDRMRQRSGSR